MRAAFLAVPLIAAACSSGPAPSPVVIPTPTLEPTYIPYPTAACWAIPFVGWIHGDPDHPNEIQFQMVSPTVHSVTFFSPRHYDLVFDPDLRVVDAAGTTVAREGDLIETAAMDAGPGTVQNERFEWCGTLTKLDRLPPYVRPTPTRPPPT